MASRHGKIGKGRLFIMVITGVQPGQGETQGKVLAAIMMQDHFKHNNLLFMTARAGQRRRAADHKSPFAF
jgi:hypothetical protein